MSKYMYLIKLLSIGIIDGKMVKYRECVSLETKPSIGIFNDKGGIVYCKECMENRVESVIEHFHIENIKIVII